MNRLLILLLVLASGCTSVIAPIQHHTAPCTIPPVPPYPDTKEALSEAPGLLGRDALKQQGGDARDEHEKKVTLVKKRCHL